MSGTRFILAGLKHFRRIHVAVALGVAVATAVLTGALLVGDSVRGSLRSLTLERLGRIDFALVSGHFFRDELADELSAEPAFTAQFGSAEPALLLAGTLQARKNEQLRSATQVSVVGTRDSFWSLGQGGPEELLGDNDLAITEPLARELIVAVGDELELRLPTSGAIPADSPLGDKEDTSRVTRYRVGAVLPPRGLARFGLMPSQHAPRNVFVRLQSLQRQIEQTAKANSILVARRDADGVPSDEAQQALTAAFQPRLVDFGIKVQELDSPTRLLQISADQLVLPDAVVEAAGRMPGGEQLQPVVTYLANTISVGDGAAQRKIPYSTISGVDSTAELGPLLDEDGTPIVLGDDEIVLNRWAAEDLGAEVGDQISITFYEPESTHGVLREREPPPKFMLRAIVDLETADGQATRAADPTLTPELPGVTDQQSISDWDLPFELVEKIRPQDEEYWDEYRTTPKAFVSLATAKRLWPSRWGTTSLLRLPIDAIPSMAQPKPMLYVMQRMNAVLRPDDVGMSFLPVKAQGLAASAGTTPFDLLFFGFSMFLIAAALMLVSLLFQLGIEQRAAELGTLAALGISRKQIAKLLSREGLVVASVGAAVGVAAGIAYAWLLVTGLRTWWLAAIATPFLELHVPLRSIVIGWLVGVAAAWLTIRWSIRRLTRVPANQLLQGTTTDELRGTEVQRKRGRWWLMLRPALVVLTIALVMVGFKLTGEAQAGAFFACGATVLALLLGEVAHRLRTAGRRRGRSGSLSLASLAALNIKRKPGRSTLTIGLVAAATFLIVAISAFRLDTGVGGTGGFALVATSDQPIYFDLNDPDARQLELGFTSEESGLLDSWRIFPLRVAAGEDASCLNLYRPAQPRVLGVPKKLIERGGFDASPEDPWPLLEGDLGSDADGRPIVPVVLDASTAIYSLHLQGVGARFEIRDAADQPVQLEVVGLLKNSVLQGNLLVSERSFLKLFPDTAGYRFFLMEPTSTATVQGGEIAELLESKLVSDGFDATDANEKLAGFLAVQNTYLSTFQSLGALGLLLGTVGLAIAQLRSVLERRAELALMRATGFRGSRVVQMVLLENAALLLGGLLVGCIAAAVALVPQWAPQQASVPWSTLAALLGVVAVVGLLAGWLATRSALRAPLVPALRGE